MAAHHLLHYAMGMRLHCPSLPPAAADAPAALNTHGITALTIGTAAALALQALCTIPGTTASTPQPLLQPLTAERAGATTTLPAAAVAVFPRLLTSPPRGIATLMEITT